MSWDSQNSLCQDIHGECWETRDNSSEKNIDFIRSIWTEPYLDNVGIFHEYMASSLVRESPEMDQIREAVKKAGIFIVLGYFERDGDSLYIAQSFIDPTGAIVLHRRKIKPTGAERAIWGEGQGEETLVNVADSPFGRIGALNCWEHFQPLLRYHEYSQGVDIHIAGWPPILCQVGKHTYSLHHNGGGRPPCLSVYGHGRGLLCRRQHSSDERQRQGKVEAGWKPACADPRRRFRYDLWAGWNSAC